MRSTVPRFCGICRRGPSVGSAAAATIGAGVSPVRQMSVEYQSGLTALTCTNGAGPSETTTALPFASWPVTTRLTSRGMASMLLQPPQHVVELIEIAILNLQHAALAAVIDPHGEAERIRQPALERNRIGILHRALLDRLARVRRTLLRQRLDLSNVEPALDDLARHLLRIVGAHQHARGTGGDLAGVDVGLD